MIYTPSRIPGAWIMDVEPVHDQRGFFAMTWLPEELRKRGMDPALAQCNLAFNHKRGTLRGMHLQSDPHAQIKIVRATRGALLDVIVDLRPDSPTFKKWDAVELTADNRRMLYIPAGIAHGYLTLSDDTEAYLPRVDAVGAQRRARRALERSGVRDRVAVHADGDLVQGRGVASA